jgi:hypothetical protein
VVFSAQRAISHHVEASTGSLQGDTVTFEPRPVSCEVEPVNCEATIVSREMRPGDVHRRGDALRTPSVPCNCDTGSFQPSVGVLTSSVVELQRKLGDYHGMRAGYTRRPAAYEGIPATYQQMQATYQGTQMIYG